MSPANPFQIPACLQQADLQQRRRQRFKKTVIAVMFGVMAMLVVLLIQGCVSEHAKVAIVPAAEPSPAGPAPVKASVAAPKPNVQASPVAQPVVVASQKSLPPAGHGETVYVVKSGDNLTRIARSYGTTIKAIRAANDLADDRIVIGAKLKIPQA